MSDRSQCCPECSQLSVPGDRFCAGCGVLLPEVLFDQIANDGPEAPRECDLPANPPVELSPPVELFPPIEVAPEPATAPSPQPDRADLTCPYCFCALGQDPAVVCDSCSTGHHADCWEEYGGCSVYACQRWLERQMVQHDAGGHPAPDAIESSSAAASIPSAQMSQPGRPEAGSSDLPPSGWHADPLERHELRYWNGQRWTAYVSDAGAVSSDEYGTRPTPLPLPPGGQHASANWYTDPAGRHRYRFWDGRQWTDKVADAGVESTDPPRMKL